MPTRQSRGSVVRPTRSLRQRRDVGRGGEQCAACDVEHLAASRDAEEIIARPRKRRAAGVGVERIANGDFEQRVDVECIVQRSPDVTRFLRGDRGNQIDAERCAGNRRFDLIMERRLEPVEGLAC